MVRLKQRPIDHTTTNNQRPPVRHRVRISLRAWRWPSRQTLAQQVRPSRKFNRMSASNFVVFDSKATKVLAKTKTSEFVATRCDGRPSSMCLKFREGSNKATEQDNNDGESQHLRSRAPRSEYWCKRLRPGWGEVAYLWNTEHPNKHSTASLSLHCLFMMIITYRSYSACSEALRLRGMRIARSCHRMEYATSPIKNSIHAKTRSWGGASEASRAVFKLYSSY